MIGTPSTTLRGTMRTSAGRKGQKMVDTMLASDLLTLRRSGSEHLVVVTDDEDLVPPLLQAAAIGGRAFSA